MTDVSTPLIAATARTRGLPCRQLPACGFTTDARSMAGATERTLPLRSRRLANAGRYGECPRKRSRLRCTPAPSSAGVPSLHRWDTGADYAYLGFDWNPLAAAAGCVFFGFCTYAAERSNGAATAQAKVASAAGSRCKKLFGIKRGIAGAGLSPAEPHGVTPKMKRKAQIRPVAYHRAGLRFCSL